MSDKELIFSARKKDFRVDYYRASGPGGQKVNKTSSACRITHIETGLFAQCQEHRVQQLNKREAFRKLADKLVAYVLQKEDGASKRYLAGDEVVRSYHEPNDRVTDHATGKTYSYKHTVGKGNIRCLVEDRAMHIEMDDD